MENDLVKKMIDKNQYLEYQKEVDKELETSSERGIVLICASVIEELLKEVLKSVLIKSHKIDKELFKGNNPLSNMESRKKMAFYLGLISKFDYKNITLMQNVRNKFAHQIVNITFENQDIINICSNFKIPKNSYMPEVVPLPKGESTEIPTMDLNPIKQDTPAKDRFVYIYKYLFFQLTYLMICDLGSRKKEKESTNTVLEIVTDHIEINNKVMNEKRELLLKEEKLLNELVNKLTEIIEVNKSLSEKRIKKKSEEIKSAKKRLKTLKIEEAELIKLEEVMGTINSVSEYTLKVINKSIE